LCPTEPNANVTVLPTTTFNGDGSKVMFAVAFTVSPVGGGNAGPDIPPPHAAKRASEIREVVRSIVRRRRSARAQCDVDAGARGGGTQGHNASSEH
jgi:hypothetical protein